jgi:hypothetical protein
MELVVYSDTETNNRKEMEDVARLRMHGRREKGCGAEYTW